MPSTPDAFDAPPENLNQLLDQLSQASAERDQLSLAEVMDAVGRRSFAPFLLVAGLVTLTPLIGDIPGVPTLMSLLVVLAAVQLLAGKQSVWLPAWLARRKVATTKVERTITLLRKPARWVDRLIKPRLRLLTGRVARYPIGLACLAIALVTPPMELIPFSATLAGAAQSMFGLALLARDGLMALAGYAFTLSTAWVIVLAI